MRFATAVVADPDLLVLDEPTVALDVEARANFWGAMRNVAAQGKTVLFATHYLEEADAYADRIVVMAEGLVIADGTRRDILQLLRQRSEEGDAGTSVTQIDKHYRRPLTELEGLDWFGHAPGRR